VLLSEVADTSRALAATRSRTAKTALLADLLSRLEPAEVGPAVGFLVGAPRQGRIGVGWSLLSSALAGGGADPHRSSALSVLDLDAALERLAATTGAGSSGARAEQLEKLFGAATPAEQELISAVLMGEVRHGALDGALVAGVAAAAGVPADLVQRAYMLSGDLRVTATLALADGAGGLAAVALEVLRPVRPMLAATAASVTEALGLAGEASVEFKLDGARIQVHRVGAEVRVFTRSLADVTHRVPEVVEAVRSLPAERLVLDGESLALDADARPRAFQDTMSRFGADAPRDQLLRPYFFDILHLDGEDLLDLPLFERARALAALVPEIARVPRELCDDADAAQAVFDAALTAGYEGVVVKALDAPYAAGRGPTPRRGSPGRACGAA